MVGGEDADSEGRQHLDEPASDAAEPHDADRRPGEVAGRPPLEFPAGLLAQEKRQPAGAGDRQPQPVLGHLIGEHAGGAGHHDA